MLDHLKNFVSGLLLQDFMFFLPPYTWGLFNPICTAYSVFVCVLFDRCVSFNYVNCGIYYRSCDNYANRGIHYMSCDDYVKTLKKKNGCTLSIIFASKV